MLSKTKFVLFTAIFFVLFFVPIGCVPSHSASVEAHSTDAASPVLNKTEDMGREYIDSMRFVGDSNTVHLINFGVLSGGSDTQQVWIPKGSTLVLDTEITQRLVYCPAAQKHMTIPEAAALERPKYLVISVGTNGIANMDENAFKFCYGSLLDSVKSASPSTIIIVQSIYPVTSDYRGFTNETVERANTWLMELASDYRVKYADTASVLKDGNGALKKEYNSLHKDGYHINKEAAEQIIYYLRTHGCS